MASELRVNTLKDASGNNSIATSFVAGGSAKAWNHFTSHSSTSIRDSFNVTSVTDNGTGQTTTALTNSFANNDYAAVWYHNGTSSEAYTSFANGYVGGLGTRGTGVLSSFSYDLAAADASLNDIIITGDLA